MFFCTKLQLLQPRYLTISQLTFTLSPSALLLPAEQNDRRHLRMMFDAAVNQP